MLLFKKRSSAIATAVICFLIFSINSAAADEWWINEYWISVSAVITDVDIEVEQHHSDSEIGPSESWTTTRYNTTYEFEYNGKTYTAIRSYDFKKTAGNVIDIKINPTNPENELTPVSAFSYALIFLSVCLIIIRLLLSFLKKLFCNHFNMS